MLSNRKQHKSQNIPSSSKICLQNKNSRSPFQDLSTTCFQGLSKTKNIINYKMNCSVEFTNKQLTFQPQIHELPVNLYPQQQNYKISRQEQYERLLQDSRRKIRQRLQAKLQKQNKKIQANCSFRPKISDFSKMLEKQKSINADNDLFKRLYEEADYKNKLIEQYANQKKKQQDNICKINRNKNLKNILNSQKHNLNPLHTRIMQVLEQRLKHRKQLQKKSQQQLSFTPLVTKSTNKIIKQKISKQDYKNNVIERLLQEHKKKQKRIQDLKQQQYKKQSQNLTFKPKINQFLSSESKQEFIQRLREASKKCYHDDLYTFHPKINDLSKLITKHLRGEQEQLDKKLQRLVYEPTLKKNNKLFQIQQQAYKQCVFNPEINQISHALQGNAPKCHKCPTPPEQIYSFKPKINDSSRLIRSKSTQISRKNKKKQLNKFKSQKQYMQMKQCTFKPKINNYRHHGLNSVQQVQGVQEYIERREKLRKRQLQQKMYEQQVFNLQKRYDERINYL